MRAPAPGYARADRLLRRWAGPALAAVALAILAATLAPFRLEARPDLWAAGPAGHLWALAAGPSHLDDALNNVLLFLPLGAAAAALLRAAAPRLGPLGRIGLAALGAAALSLGVELAQLYLPGRAAALADVAANAAGALLGALCLRLAGLWGASREALVTGMLIFLAAALAAGAQVQRSAGLDTWDAGYELLIGNERNGLRPWAGVVRDVRMASTALGPDEALALLAGEQVPAFEGALRFHYPLAGGLAEDGGRAPELFWREGPAGPQPAAGVATGPGAYLRSVAPVAAAVAAAREADAFTLAATVAARGPDQRGPARIVSISQNNSLRNLTLAQDGADLIVRVRTVANGPNGALQVLRAPGLLAGPGPRRVVATYGGARLALYAEGAGGPYTLDMVPEAVALVWLAPGDVGEAVAALPPAALVWGGWLLVHGLIGLPLGATLAWAAVGRGRRAWAWAAVGALLLPAAFEALLAAAGGRGARPANIGAEAALALGALGLFGARARRVIAPADTPMAEVRRCPSSTRSGRPT